MQLAGLAGRIGLRAALLQLFVTNFYFANTQAANPTP